MPTIHIEEPGELGELGERKFPIGSLPPILKRTAEEVAKAQGVPLALTGAAVIATASAAIGGGLVLRSGPHRTTHANLFILAAAQSGTGKGRAFSAICRPFQDIESAFRERWRQKEKPRLEAEATIVKRQIQSLEKKAEKAGPFDISSLSGELESLLQKSQFLGAQLKEPAWVVSDATREALAETLSRGSLQALASFSPEGRGVVNVLSGRYREGSTDEDIYLSAYSVESFSMHRIGRQSTHLSSPCLSLFWLVQPDVLVSMFGKDAFTLSGLLPRCLVFDSKAEPELIPEIPHVMPSYVMTDWNRLLTELVEAFHESPSVSEIRLSGIAEEAIRHLENIWIEERRSDGHLHDISSYAARWAENLLRLALVLHVSEYGQGGLIQPLGIETVRASTELMYWFIAQQLAILRPTRNRIQADKASRLQSLLRGTSEGELSLRDLEKNHNFQKADVEALANDQSSLFTIEIRKPARGPEKKVVRLRN